MRARVTDPHALPLINLHLFLDARFFHQGGSKADMAKKVPNIIQRIINNNILKIVNIVFFMGAVAGLLRLSKYYT
jgi:hypothetical protein